MELCFKIIIEAIFYLSAEKENYFIWLRPCCPNCAKCQRRVSNKGNLSDGKQNTHWCFTILFCVALGQTDDEEQLFLSPLQTHSASSALLFVDIWPGARSLGRPVCTGRSIIFVAFSKPVHCKALNFKHLNGDIQNIAFLNMGKEVRMQEREKKKVKLVMKWDYFNVLSPWKLELIPEKRIYR